MYLISIIDSCDDDHAPSLKLILPVMVNSRTGNLEEGLEEPKHKAMKFCRKERSFTVAFYPLLLDDLPDLFNFDAFHSLLCLFSSILTFILSLALAGLFAPFSAD